MNESDHKLEERLADERNRIKKGPLKIFIRVVGVSAAIAVILAEDGLGPSYLDSIGRALFWTGAVLGPMLAFNVDVLRTVLGKIVAVGLVALQCVLVCRLFDRLNGVSFISITIFAFAQFMLFQSPFMFIRKRYSGIWY